MTKEPDKKIEEQKVELTETVKKANIRTRWPDVKVLQDWDKVDLLQVMAKDPEFEYRWLRDKADNINIKTSNDPIMGYWKIVPSEHLDELEKKFDVEILRAPDGLCRKGDLILAYMPKKFYMGKVKVKEQKAKAATSAVIERLEKGHPGKGILTEKQLGMEGKDYKR